MSVIERTFGRLPVCMFVRIFDTLRCKALLLAVLLKRTCGARLAWPSVYQLECGFRGFRVRLTVALLPAEPIGGRRPRANKM